MTTTETTQATQADTTSTPVRATWKQHGTPLSGFQFYGTAVKAPAEAGQQVAKVVTGKQGVTLKAVNGRALKGGAFGTATKFWAVVPEDAPRQAAPAKAEPKPKADPLPKVEIKAAKGGTQTVPPIRGAVAKAIAETGKSIQQIAREHGQNPSQLRRLAADSVAKVDVLRAQSIATALGATMTGLFGAPEDKTTKATAKAE